MRSQETCAIAAILRNQTDIDQSKSEPLMNAARRSGPGSSPDQSPRTPNGLNLASTRRLQQL
jgi:hypothetical protein